MSMAPSQLGAFVRSDPARVHANLQYHVQPLSLRAYDQPHRHLSRRSPPASAISIPTAAARVRIRSANIADPPRIAPNYLSTDEDRRVAADRLRVTRRIVAQPALARYFPEEHLPGRAVQHRRRTGARRRAHRQHHLSSRGHGAHGRRVDDAGAVVDSHLRVRGVDGLRVVDASVMPTITSGNTNSPTLMIAEKAARWIIAGV